MINHDNLFLILFAMSILSIAAGLLKLRLNTDEWDELFYNVAIIIFLFIVAVAVMSNYQNRLW